MRTLAPLLVLIGLLAVLPAPAQAGGRGRENCPAGLVAQRLDSEEETELTTPSTKPRTVEGVILIPERVESPEGKPAYDYVWGETVENNVTMSALLCGVKPATGASTAFVIALALVAFTAGAALLAWVGTRI